MTEPREIDVAEADNGQIEESLRSKQERGEGSTELAHLLPP
jgi:hypothetical protein